MEASRLAGRVPLSDGPRPLFCPARCSSASLTGTPRADTRGGQAQHPDGLDFTEGTRKYESSSLPEVPAVRRSLDSGWRQTLST